MSPEDAKKWKDENEKNRDKFKSASADIPIELGYDALNIFQRYWGGQGDPLYAMLSRRGTSVSIVKLDVSQRELDRFEDVAQEIVKTSDDPSEVRVAKVYLKRIPEWKRSKHASAALQWKAGADMAPKFDPSFQQQLSLMMRNPPKISQVEGMMVIEIFSPFVKKYIPQAEYTSAEAAQKDLNVWLKAHRETLQNLRGAVRDEKTKTASLMEFFKPDADWWQGFLAAGRRNHAWLEAWKADDAR
jgi:hypothetical protein